MKTSFYITLLVTLLLLSGKAHCCSIIDKSWFPSPIQAYQNAKQIYLVELVAAEHHNDRFHYQFKVKQTYKGKKQERLSIDIPAIGGYIKPSQNHKELSFWLPPYQGGTFVNSLCESTPSFNLGHQYMLLQGEKGTIRDYEYIVSKDDRWMQLIESMAFNKPLLPVFKLSEVTSQIESLSTFQCPGKGERQIKFVQHYRGKTLKILRPASSDVNCSGTGIQFAQFWTAGGRLPYFVPITKEGSLDFSNLTDGVVLMEGNLIPLKAFVK